LSSLRVAIVSQRATVHRPGRPRGSSPSKPKPEESILESPYIGLAALAARVRYEWRGSSSTDPAFLKGSEVPARTLPKSLLPASVPLVKSSATARVCSRTRSPSEFVGRACSRTARRGSGGSPVRIETSRREVRVESRSESRSAPARLPSRLESVKRVLEFDWVDRSIGSVGPSLRRAGSAARKAQTRRVRVEVVIYWPGRSCGSNTL
jgi:hypothetical protein